MLPASEHKEMTGNKAVTQKKLNTNVGIHT